MIDVYLDAFRTEVRIESAGGAGQALISPFSSQQPAATHVRYHMPPRFSKEVVRGIRHAAAKAFQVCFATDFQAPHGTLVLQKAATTDTLTSR